MNPWLIIGFIVALGGAWWAGDHHGHSVENDKWTLSQQKEQLAFDQKYQIALGAQRAAEHAYSDLKDQTDAQHSTDVKAIADGKRAADAAVANGLRRAKSCNIGTGGNVPGDSQPKSGDGGGTTDEFYLLPLEAPKRLSDRYAEADYWLSLYRGCRTRLQDAIAKSRAPR